MKKIISRIIAVLLVSALSLSLIGCGSDETSKGDGVFDIAITSGLTSLTPFVTNSGRDSLYMDLLYESLGYVDYEKKLNPWVAESWEISDDNLTYTVKIHDNVYDNAGNHITAADVVWFIGKANELALKPVFNKLDSWKQIDDYTFSMTLKADMIGVFEYLMEDIFIVSQKAYEESKDEFGTECISTSQYKITEFVASSDFAFELNDNYWGDPKDWSEEIQYNVEKVKFHVIAEASQISAAFATGLVDYMDGASITTAAEMLNDPDNYTVLEYEGHQGYQLFFSGYENDGTGEVATKLVANDVYLRQAICYAINNQALIDGYAQGHGTLLHDVCPKFYNGYQDSWDGEEYYEYSVEKAKECLAKSDYDGSTLVILCHTSFTRIAEIIVNDLAATGINAEVYAPESALWASIRLNGEYYDMFINSIGGTYLPDHWSIRYDPNAYATGDGTSRHDYVLGDLLYAAYTRDGFNTENINAVHNYLKDNAIAYGLMNMSNFCVYSNRIKLVKEIDGFTHKCSPLASTWEGI